jgi:hypothetical protein
MVSKTFSGISFCALLFMQWSILIYSMFKAEVTLFVKKEKEKLTLNRRITMWWTCSSTDCYMFPSRLIV